MADIGAPELLIIAAVLVLLFGASKLPELARGAGSALRIFKTETRRLDDDDEAPAGVANPNPNPSASTEADLNPEQREA